MCEMSDNNYSPLVLVTKVISNLLVFYELDRKNNIMILLIGFLIALTNRLKISYHLLF